MNSDRQILFEKLRERQAFWSYRDVRDINDDLLIEKVMLLLDIEDINSLFKLFDKTLIRKVWEDKILRQEPYYHGLNRFFAWFYFSIENPDEYIENRKNHLHN